MEPLKLYLNQILLSMGMPQTWNIFMVFKKANSIFCRICGLEQDEMPWGADGQSPTFDFCPCCGVEFGYQDCQLSSIHTYRKRWLQEVAHWAESEKMKKNWSLEEQMKNIPNEFK